MWVFVLCGIVSMLAKTPAIIAALRHSALVPTIWILRGPSWISALPDVGHTALAGTLFFYFASAGLCVFGSGLAIVPFLHGGVVVQHAWLTERQFLDAVAVALLTPGPVVITVAFIGVLARTSSS